MPSDVPRATMLLEGRSEEGTRGRARRRACQRPEFAPRSFSSSNWGVSPPAISQGLATHANACKVEYSTRRSTLALARVPRTSLPRPWKAVPVGPVRGAPCPASQDHAPLLPHGTRAPDGKTGVHARRGSSPRGPRLGPVGTRTQQAAKEESDGGGGDRHGGQ